MTPEILPVKIFFYSSSKNDARSNRESPKTRPTAYHPLPLRLALKDKAIENSKQHSKGHNKNRNTKGSEISC